MRRFWIHHVLPAAFCLVPPLGAGLVFAAVPPDARRDYLARLETSAIDWLILALGLSLFAGQTALAWRALRWADADFDRKPDRWLSHLSQGAEWFPLLGLIGTVAAILQTFSSIMPGSTPTPQDIIKKYAPAITATGSGLFMALVNILPTWIVAVGRDVIGSLAGAAPPPSRRGRARWRTASWSGEGGPAVITPPRRSVTRFFIPLIDVLILLFCIFLLMPFVSSPPAPEAEKGAAPEPPPAPPPADVQELQRQLAEARRRLDRAQRERASVADRLSVRVLEIDRANGTLFYFDPDRQEVRSQADAQRLIDRQRRLAGAKDPFFLILYPRELSGYPEQAQIDTYRQWFKDVPFGFDSPYSGG